MGPPGEPTAHARARRLAACASAGYGGLYSWIEAQRRVAEAAVVVLPVPLGCLGAEERYPLDGAVDAGVGVEQVLGDVVVAVLAELARQGQDDAGAVLGGC